MSTAKTGEEEKTISSDEDFESSTNSSSLKSSSKDKNIQKNINIAIPKDSGIIEVYKDNFIQEMKNLTSLIKEYNYIGMDTEYPGIVYSLSSWSDDFYYKSLKINVDSLKLIQLGITLSNDKGEFPTPHRTWQFNFEFDFAKDKSSLSSLDLLKNSGIDFNKLKKSGINHQKFIEQFKTSGLVLNPNIHWISFHGSYDFAYLLSNLLGNSLPKNENEFTDILRLFFPNHYDIRILVNNKNHLKGSLNKLANYLNVEREGKVHQAGSDSLVTIQVFWKLINNGIISKKKLIEDENIIYGISKGKNNKETINYTKINNDFINSNIMNINHIINMKTIMNNNRNYNFVPFANNNAFNNFGMNYCYPQMVNNGLFKYAGYNGLPMMNKRTNFIQYC